MLFTQLYVRVGIVLTRGKHFHNLTTLRRGGGELIKLVIPRHFLVPVPNQECVMYLCVRDIDFVCFYDFPIWFWNCSDIVVFGLFILIRWLSLIKSENVPLVLLA
jgi:hypothetical protein